MIQKILTLFLSVSLLTSCGSDNDSFTNDSGSNNGNNSSSTIIATPGMAKPVNPIPESAWAGSWNDKNNPNYPGGDLRYNPLQGEWILTAVNGKTTDQFLVYQILYSVDCATLLQKPAEGKEPEYKNYQKLQINNTQIKDERGYIYNYALASDRSWMTLYDGTNTYTFGVYDNNGVWYWKGDWNSKSSPYYSVYQGKYNPVKGTWKVYLDNDYKPGDNRRIIFVEDFFIYKHNITLDGINGKLDYVGKYEINDIGFKINAIGILGYATNKYWIQNDTLYLQGILNNNKLTPEISKLIRIAN